jgi:hypothetical protein
MGHHITFTDDTKMDATLAASASTKWLGIIGLGVLGSAYGFFVDQAQFFFSYLNAFMFAVTLALGCLFFVIIHHLVRASWSTGFRRLAENYAANLPLLLLLFIPVAFGHHDLYHWSHEGITEIDPLIAAKSGYLNTAFFFGRALFFFAIWILMIRFFRKNSVKQDETGDTALTFKMRWWSPLCMIGWALSITFAGFDWLMSLDPHWFSTMFGVIIFAGSVVTCFAILNITGLWLTKNGVLANTLTMGNFHDAAKLMFGFTCFWAYTSFSQYFLIWYGNIPEETAWFHLRLNEGWENVALLLVFGHFILPFWFLMSRHMKRNRFALGVAAVWMLLIHYIDLFFMIQPTHMHHFGFSWIVSSVSTLMVVGGLCVYMTLRRMTKDAVVAHRDPQLTASMNYDNS